jgi:heme-degrading monooxygenase HmoA
MTYAAFFDVLPKSGFGETYFRMAADLKPIVEKNPGFISVERFQNFSEPDWYLSFSQWTDERVLAAWRCQKDHHQAQVCGRDLILEDYRLRVGALTIESNIAYADGKSLIFSAIGSFDNIQSVSENHRTMFAKRTRFFKGVINPDRGFMLADFESGIPLDEMRAIFTNGRIEVSVFEVKRDYGMFNRAQAPEVFV